LSHPENVGLRCANPTYPASKLFSEALKSHKLKQLTGKAIQCVLMELAVGSVIVDVGVWGFLEVLYRPFAALGAVKDSRAGYGVDRPLFSRIRWPKQPLR